MVSYFFNTVSQWFTIMFSCKSQLLIGSKFRIFDRYFATVFLTLCMVQLYRNFVILNDVPEPQNLIH
jgi:hypothetical protein